MTKEIEYTEVRILVGLDSDDEVWLTDTADENWFGENGFDWSQTVAPRRILLRIPRQENQPVVVTLPENPSEDVKVEVVAA